MRELSQDFQDLIELFTSHGVEFIVVGAYALAYLGHNRYTEDIDLWIDRSPVNADRVRAALAEFGIPIDDDAERQLAEDRHILQFGVKPQRVDILTFLDGCDYGAARGRAMEAKLGGNPVFILSLED